MSGVYLIRHRTTGRAYVGASSVPELRWKEHLQAVRRGDAGPLYDAMRADGEEAFEFVIVRDFGTRRHAHFIFERETIAKLAATPEGIYNKRTSKPFRELSPVEQKRLLSWCSHIGFKEEFLDLVKS